MFLGNDIIEFIDKIIEIKEITTEDKIKNIEKFRDYLELTKTVDEETLKCIEKIINCLPEIFILKQKLNSFDLNYILKEELENIDKKDNEKAKEFVKSYNEKHYHHYNDYSSDYCGSSSISSRSC